MDLSEGSGDLWRYLRDLVALSTLPAMWVGQPSHTIAESVADALNSTLHADFTYVRLASVDASGATVEAACTERGSADAAHAQEIGRVLEPWLRPNGYASVAGTTPKCCLMSSRLPTTSARRWAVSSSSKAR